MKDGISLARSLASVSKGKSLHEALREYELEMVPRSTKAVLDSRGSAFVSHFAAGV